MKSLTHSTESATQTLLPSSVLGIPYPYLREKSAISEYLVISPRNNTTEGFLLGRGDAQGCAYMVRGGWHSLQASKRAAPSLKLNTAWFVEGQGPRQGTQHDLMLSGKAPAAALLPAES